jgi:hypothetical protein
MNKLVEFQVKLKAPKGKFNSFGNYNYRSCEDILEAVKPIIHPEGFYLIFEDAVVQVGERYYFKAEAILTNGEEKFTGTGFAREEEGRKGMDASQVSGSASSYARKYALNALFAIDDAKDADTDEHRMEVTKRASDAKKPDPKPDQKKTPAKNLPQKPILTEKQFKQGLERINDGEILYEKIMKKYNVRKEYDEALKQAEVLTQNIKNGNTGTEETSCK